MFPTMPKTLNELETQHAQLRAQVKEWQERAAAWAAEHGMDMAADPTPADFFDWLTQHEHDERLEAAEEYD